MHRTILYPTDLGIFSSYLFQHVTEMALVQDARIVVVHAVEPLGVFADAVLETYISPDQAQELKDQGLDLVMEAIRAQVEDAFEQNFIDTDIDAGFVSDIHVVTGRPSSVILSAVDSYDADLIVMGSRGERNDSDKMLGSVVSKVLRMSSVPVFMVPITDGQPH